MDSERLDSFRRQQGFQQQNVNEQKSLRDRWNGVNFNQNVYDFRYLVFPETLGIDDNGHYMVININAPTNTWIASNPDDLAGRYNRLYSKPVDPIVRSKVDQLRLAAPRLDVPGFENLVARRTRRIQQSIALYMPSPLVFNHNNVYEEVSLTALAGKLMIGSVSAVAGLAGAAFNNWLQLAGAAAAKIMSGIGQGTQTVSQLMQRPINPMVEILFTTTEVRSFTFELLLAPRNEKESQALYSIVKTLRFHATPEYSETTLGGVLWIPPSEFDITFYNKGVENLNILRINTCVMERIEVDYSPAGVYSTFRNGHPVAVRLSMAFRELEPLHKERIAQGF